MKSVRDAMLLYAVTDRMWLNGRKLCEVVEEALKGGATMVQLREKELSFADFLSEAKEIKKVCEKYQVPFVINDNVEVALACDADGVHVGQSDMEAACVREKIGSNKILGVSVQTVQQALDAEKKGADYLGVGAVFTTSTKSDADFVSYEKLKAICRTVSVPVCAIGGIYKHNLLQLSGSGIDGVALVSAIFASDHIDTECRELLALSKKMIISAAGAI